MNKISQSPAKGKVCVSGWRGPDRHSTIIHLINIDRSSHNSDERVESHLSGGKDCIESTRQRAIVGSESGVCVGIPAHSVISSAALSVIISTILIDVVIVYCSLFIQEDIHQRGKQHSQTCNQQVLWPTQDSRSTQSGLESGGHQSPIHQMGE